MPVDFLTDEQEQRYGRYAGEPTTAQRARYFYLDDADRELLAERRGDHNRVGLGLQIVTARFLGTFLPDPTNVPAGVIAHVTAQLGITSKPDLRPYRDGEARWDHAAEIRRRYGYRDFTDQPEHFLLMRWLYTRAWLSTERPSVLFDLATARLVDHKILLPGVSVLTRLVASVRDRVAARLWRTLAACADPELRQRLNQLLVIPAGARQTPLDRLRRAPTRVTAAGLVDALHRLDEVRTVGAGTVDLTPIPPGRLTVLARYAAMARAQAIARMPDERRIAMLLAFAHAFEVVAQDDALDLLEQLTGALLARVERAGDRERLRTLRDLDSAAQRLRDVCQIVLDPQYPDAEVRAAVQKRWPEAQLLAAITIVGELTRSPDDGGYYEELLGRYSHVRRFLPALLRAILFEATPAGRSVVDALGFLRRIEGAHEPRMREAPLGVVNRPWRRLVLTQDHHVERRAYTFCTLERLQDGLRR